MIDAKELRLNNYVLFDEQVDKIFSLGQAMCSGEKHSHWYYERLDPIPITPEILEKCGFKHWRNGWYNKDYFTNCNEAVEEMTISINLSSFRFSIFDKEGGYPVYVAKQVKFLHLLQNGIYFLTGTELEVTL